MVQANAVIEAHHAGSWKAETHFRGDRVSFLKGTSKAAPGDPNPLTRHTGTVEYRESLPVAPGSTLAFVQYGIRDDVTGRVINVNSGRVRMLDNQEPPAAPKQETAAPVPSVETAAPVAPKMIIGQRFEEERYTMRGTDTRPSDRVHSWYRRINGRLFGFCRMYWAEDGVTTLSVYRGRSTERLHFWQSV